MHVVQSPEWGEFKTEYRTQAVRAGNVQYTKHKIPFTSFYYGYAPKVDPTTTDWDEIKKSAKENNCVTINFDIPNILIDSKESKKAINQFKKYCKKSPKDTFAKHNVILDLSKDEEVLLSNLHSKHRYNIRYAQRKGVVVETATSNEDFKVFLNLLKEAADRQKYYIHTEIYYKKVWEILGKKEMCHILIAKYKNEPLVAWMLFAYENVLYYPYGGSTPKHKNLHPSCLIGWETIKLGKELGCQTFDMWGAAKDPKDKSDPWYGFTNFKIKFGGAHVQYIDSYDLIINEPVYHAFNFANDVRWKLLNLLK